MIDNSPEFTRARKDLTYSGDLKFPGMFREPSEQLVRSHVKYRERVKPLLPTAGYMFQLMSGLKHHVLKPGNLRIDEQPVVYLRRPLKKYEPLDMLETLGEQRVIRVKKIVTDLKEEGVDRFIEGNVEQALVAFAVLHDSKEQLAIRLAKMNPQERTRILGDLEMLPGIFSRLYLDSSREFGLLPMVRDEDKVVLKRYFALTKGFCHSLAVIEQLDDLREELGMPLMVDGRLEKLIAPFTEMDIKSYQPPKKLKTVIPNWIKMEQERRQSLRKSG